MKSIAQSIDSLPLHLNLPLIRFNDALGESWAIPFQACTTWQAFKEMLTAVIFREQRPGFDRVIKNQFVLKIAKRNRDVPPSEWKKRIEPGMHIEQWMSVPELEVADSRACPFPECDGTPSDISRSPEEGTWYDYMPYSSDNSNRITYPWFYSLINPQQLKMPSLHHFKEALSEPD